ncbi:MAG: proteinase inhibitor-like protein [Dehalococcoidia bacterium]|nr:MAG: proteinase inhibitor-like protein [Dehalococcoidia bacterium]
MKRLWLLVIVAAAVTCLAAGCIGKVETYTDSGQRIEIGINNEFVIALGSNPTTGYSWQESHDESMLRLVESKFEPAEDDVVGAGGIEYFRFRALKTGDTEVTLVYKRAWEEEILDEKVFAVTIK